MPIDIDPDRWMELIRSQLESIVATHIDLIRTMRELEATQEDAAKAADFYCVGRTLYLVALDKLFTAAYLLLFLAGVTKDRKLIPKWKAPGVLGCGKGLTAKASELRRHGLLRAFDRFFNLGFDAEIRNYETHSCFLRVGYEMRHTGEKYEDVQVEMTAPEIQFSSPTSKPLYWKRTLDGDPVFYERECALRFCSDLCEYLSAKTQVRSRMQALVAYLNSLPSCYGFVPLSELTLLSEGQLEQAIERRNEEVIGKQWAKLLSALEPGGSATD